MSTKQIIAPVGGLNRDDDPRYFEQGDYLEMINMRTGYNQNENDSGLSESILSNYEIPIPVGDGEDVFVKLTVAKDDEHKTAYILCFYDKGPEYFQIYKFVSETDVAELIYQSLAQSWGITENTKIYNPRIIDGKIIWTDNDNSVKYVDLIRLETSYKNGIGIETLFPWNEDEEYAEGQVVYFYNKYYRSKQNTNLGFNPNDEDDYWEPLCEILDAYGYILNGDNFTLAAKPPLLALMPIYVNDSTRNSNNLRKQTFQISYRYVYIDYRKSSYAPPSMIPPPSQEETEDGMMVADQTHHNGLSMQIPTGSDEVRIIEVIGRSSEDPTKWFLIAELRLFDRGGARTAAPNSFYEYTWFNDEARIIANQNEVYSLFSFIPIRAKHMELLSGNILSFGNIVEGRDRVQSNVETELSYTDLESAEIKKIYLDVRSVVFNTYYSNGIYYQAATLSFFIPKAKTIGTFIIDINAWDVNVGTINYHAEYIYNGSGSYFTTVQNGIISAISAAGWISKLTTTTDGAVFSAFIDTGPEGQANFMSWSYKGRSYILQSIYKEVNKYPALKEGCSHSWGIVYRDSAGVISPVVGAQEIVKYIPFVTEQAATTINKIPVVDFKIYHAPPDWAESYEIVYAGNKTISWSIQLLAYNLRYGKPMASHDDPRNSIIDTRYYRLSLEEMYQRTREKLPHWSVEQYVWEKGDRIRIIGKVDVNGVLSKFYNENRPIIDVEIIGVYDDTDYITFLPPTGLKKRAYLYFQADEYLSVLTNPATNVFGFDDVFIEIYRPYKELQTTLFYTAGMTYSIKKNQYGYKYHGGVTDQEISGTGEVTLPAVTRNTAHDIWKYRRNFVDKVVSLFRNFWVECMYSSDYFITQKLTSTGIPIPDLFDYGQTYLPKRIRHGGRYGFGTQINNLAQFDYDDFKDMKDEYGPIEGMKEAGFILKVLQHSKIISIYIQRIESFSPSGQAQYLFTDKVFGSVRPEISNYGTMHPESLCAHRNNLYFWDQKEGAVVRDALNGAFPISQYKMFKFFLEKARFLDECTESAVYFYFDVASDILYCAFIGDGEYETIAFSEKDNRWKFTHTGKIEKPFWFGKKLYHLFGRSIYEWNRDEGQGYLNLSGEGKSWQLVLVANESPMKLKHFNAIAVYQTGATPSATLEVPEKASAVGRQMTSVVAPNGWNLREGIYYGQILRDADTPNITGTNNRLINGLRLRGQYMLITLSGNEPDQVTRIFTVMALSTPSERSL